MAATDGGFFGMSAWRWAWRGVLVAVGLLVLAGCQSATTGLRGQVTIAGTSTAAPFVQVELFSAASADPSNPTKVAETTTDANGGYQVPLSVSESTTYRVRFGGTQWHPGVADFASAADVTVEPGAWTVLNQALPMDIGSMAGTVTDTSTSPIEGVTVEAKLGADRTTVAATTTDAAGTYSFDFLAPGDYVLRFEKAGMTTRYSGSVSTASSATVITVTANGAITGVDVVLAPESQITGSITPGIADVTIGAFADDELVALTTTDSSGSFVLNGLDAGPHTLAMGGHPVRTRSFGTDTFDPAAATVFSVGAAATVDVGAHTAYGIDCDPGLLTAGADLTSRQLMSCDLSGLDLTGATLTDANLTNAYAVNANLTNVTLTNANLSGAYIGYVNMTGATLTDANIQGAAFEGSTMTGVISGGITGTPYNLPFGWVLANGHLVGPGANLTNANLAGANLTGLDLTGLDLTGVDLTGANLTNVTLTNAALTGVELSGATLTGVVSGGITGAPTSLPAGWQLINGYLVGSGANLAGANLTGANLTGLDLTSVYAVNANLTNATLTNAQVGGAWFDGATMTGVTSGGITTTPYNLPTGWILFNGYLVGPGANLAGANLSGADLTNADLTGADLTGADLANANLTNTELTGVDLSGATLTGVVSGGITGTPTALPAGWILTNGYLVGSGANLAGANLSGANLTGLDLTSVYAVNANLTNVTLTNAQIGGAWFDGATLTGVVSGGITTTPYNLPTGWILFNGYLVGPGANLAGANLSGADLTNADLTGANLTNANLTNANLTNVTLTNVQIGGAWFDGATLTGVVSGGTTGTPTSLPAGWQFINGHLAGPGADLAGADFSYVFLDGANLAGANLTDANLTDANLENADLSNANLTRAELMFSYIVGTNFGGANLASADLLHAWGHNESFETAWHDNTRCPNGTLVSWWYEIRNTCLGQTV